MEHKCPKDIGRLVTSLVPVVFESLPIKAGTREEIADELTRYSDVSEEQLSAFVAEIQGIDSEEAQNLKELFSYGNGRDTIIGNLAKAVASCKKCRIKYRYTLHTLVNKDYYETLEEADRDLLNLYS